MRQRNGNSRAGFTLVETLIASTLLIILFLVASRASLSASDAYDATQARSTLGRSASHAASLLVEALSAASRSGLTPDPEAFETSMLEFAQAEGFDGESVTFGPTTQVRWGLDPNELDDGLDNDGDGLVDEGRVLWTDGVGTAAEHERTICRNVREMLEGELPNGIDDNGNGLIDEQGLSFTATGDVVTVRLTLERLDKDGRRITRTVETSARVWND